MKLSKFKSVLSIFVTDQIINTIVKIITIILIDIRNNASKVPSHYLKYRKYSLAKPITQQLLLLNVKLKIVKSILQKDAHTNKGNEEDILLSNG